MVMEKSGLDCALDIIAKAYQGAGFSIPNNWAEKLIRDHDLKLRCGSGDMTGEFHAMFRHNGQDIRLKKDWMGHYMLYHGEWKPDPHWAGD